MYSEYSKVFLANGLVYRIPDKKNKASDFYFKSTLKLLEEKFKDNKVKKTSDKTPVKNIIDIALFRERAIPVNELVNLFEKEGILAMFRKSSEVQLYGITYVDHITKNFFQLE
jgi:hypothetical protein